ncbi:lytic transglycosylase domain-containing protein [Nitratireductor sp. XY-223]|uniref:lytic transglycosylase domain-containing protein n=1 Tax=Nitratireductor sp. XY-223 TaxID=2561926 RepID=UPI0010A99926|nr:lytic transglycosylase domain-containing protein [Nitratireductor sp. XY-223]
MTRTGAFFRALLCAGLVSLSTAANAEEEERTKIKVDFSTITSSIFKPADPAVQKHPKFSRLINSYARKHGVPSSLAHAVVKVESNFNPKARGRAGEIGLMQIKPATARLMGYRGSSKGLYDPETNIKYGMKYLGKAHKLSGGDTCGTILRYNAGHGAKRMNPVSSRYCKKVRNILG